MRLFETDQKLVLLHGYLLVMISTSAEIGNGELDESARHLLEKLCAEEIDSRLHFADVWTVKLQTAWI
uniref:NR LBD domain-containing protein n=1 Tax=Ascaris lumbricoides TaxID=6252 RepID=A0A0M3I4G4_ASCLU